MKKKLASEMQTFQVKMLEKEQALAEQRKQMEEENETKELKPPSHHRYTDDWLREGNANTCVLQDFRCW